MTARPHLLRYSLVLSDCSLYSTHAPQLESGGRANVTVELRQDKLEDDPVFRERVLRCVVEAFS